MAPHAPLAVTAERRVRCPAQDRDVPLDACFRCGYLRPVGGAERRLLCEAPRRQRSVVETARRG